MIGSVHGCVSCPVVVKPWEPESLSRPQLPLPSLSHPPSHPYSLPQRSSSVHPLPQESHPGDKVNSSCLSPERLPTSLLHHGSRLPSNTATEIHLLSHKHGSQEKSPPAKSLSESASSNTSPTKSEMVCLSQQDIAKQYEKLLAPTSGGMGEVNMSSHKTHGYQRNNNGDGCSSCDIKNQAYLSESQTDEHGPAFPFPKPVAPIRQQHVDLFRSDNTTDKSSETKGEEPKSKSESAMSPLCIPHSSKLGSPPHMHRVNFSPTPLPAIQDKRKVSSRGKTVRQPSRIIPLTSVRPGKGLPSISDIRLQAETNQISTPPPRPTLSLIRDRKRQAKRHRRRDSENVPLHAHLKNDAIYKRRLEMKRSYALQEQQPISAVPPKLPESTDIALVTYTCKPSNASPVAGQDMASQTLKHPVRVGVTAQSHTARETPTPQSLHSSSWSLSHTTGSHEVDALTSAAAAGDMQKVKQLLAAGVDVNAVNTFGRTAIQVMTLDNTDLAELLLKAGADPNVQDEGRRAANSTFRTIAHDVAAGGYIDMLRCLLRHGADVNMQDRWGNTPLHLAAKGGHLAAVRLLRLGADLHQANLQGKTPMMLLEETGNAAAKQWVELKKSTISHLQTLCVLAVRRELGPDGLRCWSKRAPSAHLHRQILLQGRGSRLLPQPSVSTIPSSRHSAGSRSFAGRGLGNGNGHPLVPSMSGNKHITDFLTLRDLIPRRLSMGENTSLEVHNTSSSHSNDDASLCARATSSLDSETGSLFETNLSSIDASHSADEFSLPSFDQSL